MSINWQFYPKSKKIPSHLIEVIDVFKSKSNIIQSPKESQHSNEVLKVLSEGFIRIGYDVEKGKNADMKIKVPVLFGLNGEIDKYFDADAYNKNTKTVIEVEAGRAVTNYQFLKDLFQACVMYEVDYLVTAVCNQYRGNKDFEKVINFYDSIYASNRLILPFEGILIVGY